MAVDAGNPAGKGATSEAPPGSAFLIASYVVLFVGGSVLGILGAFLLPYSLSSGTSTTTAGVGVGAAHLVAASGNGQGLGQLLSVGIALALVLNPVLSLAGLRMAGTRLAAFTPLVGWLLVVLPLSGSTGDGDLVLPSGLRSVAYLLLGVIAFTAVGVLGRPTRGMTAFGGQSLIGAGRPMPVAAPKPVRSNVRTDQSGRRTAPKRKKRR